MYIVLDSTSMAKRLGGWQHLVNSSQHSGQWDGIGPRNESLLEYQRTVPAKCQEASTERVMFYRQQEA